MADISLHSFVVTLLLLTRIEIGVSLNCYQCDNVRSVSDCQHTVSCSTDESCFTDTTGADDNTRYTLGCRTKQICRQPSTTAQSPLIGRAVTQNIVCSQCCGVDLCNQHICASGVHGLHTNQCADDPKFNCGQISELFEVCNDKAHAKLVCRKFCDLCDIIDGYWLEWSSWSACSHTCGDGVLTRTRMCNRTEGGLPCTGDSSESQHCFNRTCPVDGGWASWSSWSGCSLTCGLGFQRRDRHCSNPYPGPDGDSRDDKVRWLTSCTDIAVRLVNGTSNNNGRVEISRGDNSWGTACGDGFDRTDAEVVCRMLGLPTNITILYEAGYFGYGSGPSFVTDWSCSSSETNLANCGHLSTKNRTCDHTQSVGIACVNNLHIRLVNGTDQHNGRVEASVDGKSWGPICDNGFDKYDADMICRSLGYPTNVTIPYRASWFGQAKTQHTLSSLNCPVTKNSLADCHFRPVSTTCPHSYDVGVDCTTNINVRLVNGTNNHNGRVEVSFDSGDWGPLCTSDFNSHEAKVVCRMLGYPTNLSVPYNAERFGSGTTQHILSFPSCSGSESSLADCLYKMVSNRCDHSYDVGVDCMTNINVRLVNGTNQHNGRVEVSLDGGSWGPICDLNFDNNVATVICRMLGYPTAISNCVVNCDVNINYLRNNVTEYGAAHFGQGTQPYLLSGFICQDNMRSLADCYIGNRMCGGNRAAGVWCDSNTSIEVRLVDGSSVHSGRLEISVDGGIWGTVCDTNFYATAARVACRMLGFPWSNATTFNPPDGTGLIIAVIGCTGSELSLADCRHTAWGSNPYICAHSRDIGVTCA